MGSTVGASDGFIDGEDVGFIVGFDVGCIESKPLIVRQRKK